MSHKLSGANPPESGQIFVNGMAVTFRHPLASLEIWHFAYLPKDRKAEGLFGIMTIMENLSIAIIRLLSKCTFLLISSARVLLQTRW